MLTIHEIFCILEECIVVFFVLLSDGYWFLVFSLSEMPRGPMELELGGLYGLLSFCQKYP